LKECPKKLVLIPVASTVSKPFSRMNFSSAQNYSIDPENNRLKGVKFSLSQVSGLLHRYQIKIE